MFTSRFLNRVATILAILMMILSSVQPAYAAPPANDDFGNATVIGVLPYNNAFFTDEATAAVDDPTDCTNNGSVWYAFTPATDMWIAADTFGSNYNTVLSAYTGTQGALTQVPGACNDDYQDNGWGGGLQSRVSFIATGGTTYYFLIGFCCGFGGNGGNGLTFSVQEVPPPPLNDSFVNAEEITALPFDRSVNDTGATIESGEPQSCNFMPRTVWYKFTPPTTGFFNAIAVVDEIAGVDTQINIYQAVGSGLGGLSLMGCSPNRHSSFHYTFRAVGGATYYFQAGNFSTGGGDLRVYLAPTPPPEPVAAFYYEFDPSDPHLIHFCDQSHDPGNTGFLQSLVWDYGDLGGGVTTGYCPGAFHHSPSHQYAADGEYWVQLTVTTIDGRTGSTSVPVRVYARDVSITKFSAPPSARVGQTKAITGSVKNSSRYPEHVIIELYKSVAGGGFELISTSPQFIPARRTTQFAFDYTFSPQDAQVGTVTFRVRVIILDAPDYFPGDNEAISTPPTEVKP